MRGSKVLGACGVFVILIILASAQSTSAVPVEYDLTNPLSSAFINNAYFFQYDPDSSSGTGVFDTFLRIKNSPVEHGYNTEGDFEFDTMDGQNGHTQQLQLGAIPIASYYGTDYREFRLDLNESQNTPLISLDEMKMYIADVPDLTDYDEDWPEPIYDLDGVEDSYIKMDYSLNHGSGAGDYVAWIPSDLFGEDGDKYVYLYFKMGVQFGADASFEEWGVGEEAIPEPTTICLLGFGGLALLRKRRA